LSSSPLLFNTYLDELLKQNDLLRHEVMAFIDDLVFVAQSLTELCSIINKLEKLVPFLSMNPKKSAIMVVGSNMLGDQ
jgi:hypothetical protein